MPLRLLQIWQGFRPMKSAVWLKAWVSLQMAENFFRRGLPPRLFFSRFPLFALLFQSFSRQMTKLLSSSRTTHEILNRLKAVAEAAVIEMDHPCKRRTLDIGRWRPKKAVFISLIVPHPFLPVKALLSGPLIGSAIFPSYPSLFTSFYQGSQLFYTRQSPLLPSQFQVLAVALRFFPVHFSTVFFLPQNPRLCIFYCAVSVFSVVGGVFFSIQGWYAETQCY